MDKRFIFLTLALTLALTLPLFAEDETFTITTYYPSPYGSYNELEVYRSVTYKPVNKDTLTNPKVGEMVYNASDSTVYVHNGSTWVAQGGGSGTYTAYGTTDCAQGWTKAYQGVAMVPTQGGSIVCKSGSAFTGTSITVSGTPTAMLWWTNYASQGCFESTVGTNCGPGYEVACQIMTVCPFAGGSDAAVSCAVCVK